MNLTATEKNRLRSAGKPQRDGSALAQSTAPDCPAHQRGPFLHQVEKDNLDDVDPIAIRETLAQRGIVDGQVVDPEKLDSDPFVQRVMADAQRIAAEETSEQPTPPDLSGQPITRTGDTITIGRR